jgi:hypothetical protein
MKRSSQRRIKRWFLEELTRRLKWCDEIHSNRPHILGPHAFGLSSRPAEGVSEDRS